MEDAVQYEKNTILKISKLIFVLIIEDKAQKLDDDYFFDSCIIFYVQFLDFITTSFNS